MAEVDLISKKAKRPQQYFLSVIIVWFVVALGYGITGIVGYHVVAFMLLVTVSIIAMLFEIAPVMLAAILSAVLWDYFFIPPRFTFTVGTTEDQFLLLMYFIIALVNAVLTYKIRQAEKKVREQEERANAVKFYNTLLNSLSHELRTPITTIIGAADNLQSNADRLSEENRSELVNEISLASSRLNDQVKNLLNMSRMEAGIIKPKKDWTDVGELIHSVVNNFSTTRQIEIGLSENFPLFNLDYALLEQILYNLLSNAIQYTPGDSSITVRARCGKEVISNSINMEKVIDKLIISVSDNGPGFPNAEIGRVFEKFYRLPKTKAGGTGLGLSIVKGFTEVQGGRVKLENLPTGGAKFTVEIPSETSYVNALKNE